LSDGRVLLGDLHGSSPPFKTAIWNPSDGTWTPAGSNFGVLPNDTKQDACNEETWTLLPDGSVLTVEVWNPPRAERYVPSIDEWVSAGSTPTNLPIESITDPHGNDIGVFEIGPAILLPDSRVFAVGATGQTALYTPPPPGSDPKTNPGKWTQGPTLPKDTSSGAVWPTLTVSDAPAVLQTNGKVLIVAGSLYETPPPLDYFSQNMEFFEFDPTSETIAPFAVVPFSAANAPNTWVARFLLLPTAQILLTVQSGSIWIYTPDAADNTPPQAWKPVIANCPSKVQIAGSYTLFGTQLNGLSQAVSYGDDAQIATNYPLVRLTQGSSVFYLPTSGFSTMGVATGQSVVSTQFTVPYSVSAGSYELAVIANGISSESVSVEVVPSLDMCIGTINFLQQMLNAHLHLPAKWVAGIEAQLATCLANGELTRAQYQHALQLIAELKNSNPPNGATPRLPA
jgi:hypothetical protein